MKQLDFCERESSRVALTNPQEKATSDDIDWLSWNQPWGMLQEHADELNPRQLLICVARCRVRLIRYLRKKRNPSYKLVNALHSVIDRLGPKTAEAVILALATRI